MTSRTPEGQRRDPALNAHRHLEYGTNGCLYDDPGADYFNRLHPGRAKKRAIHQLEAMGYNVTLTHAS